VSIREFVLLLTNKLTKQVK